jgi:hypothetical protein
MATETELVEKAKTRNAEWRRGRKDGEWKTLPSSGLTVRIRRMSLLDMAKAGSIPQPLVPKAVNVWEKGTLSMTELVESLDLVDCHLERAVIWPRIVAKQEDEDDSGDTLWAGAMSFDEKLSLFNWLNAAPPRLLDFLPDDAPKF